MNFALNMVNFAFKMMIEYKLQGVAGSFTTMDDAAMLAMIGDVNHHSSSPQQRALLGHTASSLYGRDLSRFTVGVDSAAAASGVDAAASATAAEATAAGEDKAKPV